MEVVVVVVVDWVAVVVVPVAVVVPPAGTVDVVDVEGGACAGVDEVPVKAPVAVEGVPVALRVFDGVVDFARILSVACRECAAGCFVGAGATREPPVAGAEFAG